MTSSYKKSGTAGGQYYIDSMALTADEAIADYYVAAKSTLEPPGVWYAGPGSKASVRGENTLGIVDGAEFDLSEIRADVERFTSLIDGFNPESGEALVQNAGRQSTSGKPETIDPLTGVVTPATPGKKGRIAMHDFALSAPKPVSVVFGLSTGQLKKDVEEAQTNASRKFLDFMSTKAYVRTGKDGVNEIKGLGLRGALFNHASSRLGDPNLHTHGVMFNFCEYKDPVTGQIKSAALETTEMMRWQGAASQIYHCELAWGMRMLGMPIERVEKLFTIPGIDPAVLTHFSKRRQEIVAAVDARLKDLGLSIGPDKASREMFATVTLQTRDDKLELARPDLERLWREQGLSLGFGEKEIAMLMDNEPLVELTEKELYEEALAAVAELTEHKAVFKENDLIVAVATRFIGKASSDQALQMTERLLQVELLKNVQERKIKTWNKDGSLSETIVREEFLATRQMVATEALAMKLGTTVDLRHVIRVAGRQLPVWLSDEQRIAALHVLESKERVALVNGAPGAGKTAMCAAIKDVYQNKGYTVVGMASGWAQSLNLRDEAKLDDGQSIAAFLTRYEHGLQKVDTKTLLVMDEAGMVSASDWAKILVIADRHGAKCLALGDIQQIAGAGSGDIFRCLTTSGGLVAAQLNNIRRQVNEDERQAAKDFLAGQSEKALTTYEKKGDVHVVTGGQEATHDAMAAKWVERTQARLDENIGEIDDFNGRKAVGQLKSREDFPELGRILLIASKNEEVADINRRVHDLRKAAGLLGNSYQYETMDCEAGYFEPDSGQPLKDMTPEERGETQEYSVGDHVAFRVNTIGDRVAFKGTLVGIKPDGNSAKKDGMVEGVFVHQEGKQLFVQTESNGIVRLDSTSKMFNREVGVIEDINELTGVMVVATDKGRIEVDHRLPKWQHGDGGLGIQLGYATNSYGSQGQTIRESIPKLDTHRAATGVQMSRHTHQAHAFIDKEFFYTKKMSESRADEWKPYQEYETGELMVDVHNTLSAESKKISTLDFESAWKAPTGAVVDVKKEVQLASAPSLNDEITEAAVIEAARELARVKAEARFAKLGDKKPDMEVNTAFPMQLTDKYVQKVPVSTREETEAHMVRLEKDSISLQVVHDAHKAGHIGFDTDALVFLGRRWEDNAVVNVSRDGTPSGSLRNRFPAIFEGNRADVHITKTGEEALAIWTYAEHAGIPWPTIIIAPTAESLSLPHVQNQIANAQMNVHDHTKAVFAAVEKEEVKKASRFGHLVTTKAAPKVTQWPSMAQMRIANVEHAKAAEQAHEQEVTQSMTPRTL